MFDRGMDGDGGAAAAVDAFCAAERAKQRAECDEFLIVADWPDRYDTTGLPLIDDAEADYRGERAVQMGGPGCPPVAEFAAAQLAPKIGWSIMKLRYLMADAVDARHRLPRLFNRIRGAELPRWTVQQISRATRDLTMEQADQVDQILAGEVTGLSGVRLERRIAAAVITVDPDWYARQAEKALRSRCFRRSQANEYGLSAIYAQLDRPAALRLEAMVKHVAGILKEHPDQCPGTADGGSITAGEWDAIALGVLAEPIRAAKLLIEHEQPDLFGQIADLFTPVEDRPLTRGPGPADYPVNDRDVPADPTGEPPDDLPEPPDGLPDQIPEPDQAPQPVEEPVAEPVPSGPREAAIAADQQPRDPEACGAAIRALLKAIPPAKLLPPITFHVHVAAEHLADTTTDHVVRIEELGPTTLAWTRHWFGDSTIINLKPVIDPAGIPPVDAYEIPDRTREAVLLRNPLSRFPYSTSLNRGNDIDHTISYRDSGPPGQTRPEHLGPAARPEHRYKTFGPIDVRQPAPDHFVWKLDDHTILIVGPDGTQHLGNTTFARAVWQCAVSLPG